MNADRAFNVLASIVTVALVTTIVRNGTKTARVVSAFGNSFSQSIRAAMGN